MKKILFLGFIFLLSFQGISAQKNLVGSYHISSGNPDDGGYTWILFENNEFAMVTFGQIIAGKWNEISKDRIQFNPYAATEPFQVFARSNSTNSGTKIIFRGLDINEDAWISTSREESQLILNPDANCLKSPIVKEFKDKITQLTLSGCARNTDCSIPNSYQFNIGNNNEFLVLYYDYQNTIPPFQGSIVEGKLSLNHGRFSSKKRAIPKTEEQDIKNYIGQVKDQYNQVEILTASDDTIVNLKPGNEESIDQEVSGLSVLSYDFNSEKGIYTAKTKFKEKELKRLNTLSVYKKLDFKSESKPLQISKGSLLTFSCN